ncbi:hypothetical protein DACRYDRAFT_113595 [Dacryopinax primogenitus]|uniref:Uncharacterized protein n=1 Tax=Dacryopinax primogenitus (strain DJM 731) TaxID=1858805 RepID=M5GGH6_DACPD|nr:uncharacterized protein DACRYDRAFT_113595 [Dacryopinax primogenitus]EJU05503.1 hypothetical protein DACRYDRAFT_113595 [Dacryopinax primogenitus]
MPKAGSQQCFRLQVTGLRRSTSTALLLERLAKEPAFADQELSNPIRLTSSNANGTKKHLFFVTVTGPPLSSEMPTILGMKQGTSLTTLWLANKGDPTPPSSRRASPVASPNSSPKASWRFPKERTPSPPRARTPTLQPAILPPAIPQNGFITPHQRALSPTSHMSQSPLASHGFVASPPSASPSSSGRFTAPFQTFEPQALAPITSPSQQEPKDVNMDTGTNGESPSWLSYLNSSPSFSMSSFHSHSPAHSVPVHSRTPNNSPATPITPVTLPPTPAKPYIPWQDSGMSFTHLSDQEAVDRLTMLLASCKPFLEDPTYGSCQEEAVRRAWGDLEWRGNVRELGEALNRLEENDVLVHCVDRIAKNETA